MKGIVKNIPKSALKMSEDKAYILGVIAGDGNIYSRKDCNSFKISLVAVDKEFVKEFKERMERQYHLEPIKIKKYYRECYKQHFCYIWSIQSKRIGLDLSRYKTGTFNWEIPKEIFRHKRFLINWLKGFYDSEAYICMPFIKLRLIKTIGLCSANKKGLMQIKKALLKLGFKKIGIKTKTRANKIYIYYWKDILLFNKLIGFTIERKKEKLKFAIKEFYKTYIERSRLKILNEISKKNGITTTDLKRKINLPFYTLKSKLFSKGSRTEKIGLLQQEFIKRKRGHPIRKGYPFCGRTPSKLFITRTGKRYLKSWRVLDVDFSEM